MDAIRPNGQFPLWWPNIPYIYHETQQTQQTHAIFNSIIWENSAYLCMQCDRKTRNYVRSEIEIECCYAHKFPNRTICLEATKSHSLAVRWLLYRVDSGVWPHPTMHWEMSMWADAVHECNNNIAHTHTLCTSLSLSLPHLLSIEFY